MKHFMTVKSKAKPNLSQFIYMYKYIVEHLVCDAILN